MNTRTLFTPALLFVFAACGGAAPRPAPASPPAQAAAQNAPAADPPANAGGDEPSRAPEHVNQVDAKGNFASEKEPPPPPAPASTPAPQSYEAVHSPSDLGARVAPPPQAGKNNCGEIDVNGTKHVLNCYSQDYAHIPNAPKPAVSHADLWGDGAHVGARPLPKVVDHRHNHSEGPVMDQKDTEACTSFSLSAAVDHALWRHTGRAGMVSPMHSWARYHKPAMYLADEANLLQGMTTLEKWPFDPKTVNDWMNKGDVDKQLLHKADAEPAAVITSIREVPFGEVQHALAAGQDVWFAIAGAYVLNLAKKTASGHFIVPDFDHRKVEQAGHAGGHAILLSGYASTPGGVYYLIHNSWGEKYAEGGYVWIHEKTLKTNAEYFFLVDAYPTDHATAHRPVKADGWSACKAPLIPDSITGQCVPKCRDGSPRFNGVCPVAGHCPAGDVNLSGVCVAGAPPIDKTFRSPYGELHVKCAAGGCTYFAQKGTIGCARESGCEVSCPAPELRLVPGARGKTPACVE